MDIRIEKLLRNAPPAHLLVLQATRALAYASETADVQTVALALIAAIDECPECDGHAAIATSQPNCGVCTVRGHAALLLLALTHPHAVPRLVEP